MGPREHNEFDASDNVTVYDSGDSHGIDPKSAKPIPDSDGVATLRAQCRAAKDYPKNIAEQGYATYQVNLKYGQLREQSPRIFCREDRATIVFHEFSKSGKGSSKITLPSCYVLSTDKNSFARSYRLLAHLDH